MGLYAAVYLALALIPAVPLLWARSSWRDIALAYISGFVLCVAIGSFVITEPQGVPNALAAAMGTSIVFALVMPAGAVWISLRMQKRRKAAKKP